MPHHLVNLRAEHLVNAAILFQSKGARKYIGQPRKSGCYGLKLKE